MSSPNTGKNKHSLPEKMLVLVFSIAAIVILLLRMDVGDKNDILQEESIQLDAFQSVSIRKDTLIFGEDSYEGTYCITKSSLILS